MEKIIPNTNERYSITSEGVVYSLYKTYKDSERVYKKKEVPKSLDQTKTKTFVKLNRKGNITHSLMIKNFNLQKPDNFHDYHIIHKDNNPYNDSISNLEWRIKHYKNFIYYPQPYYNKKGEIISKCCSKCNNIQEIKNFILQKKRNSNHYINYCIFCIKKRNKKQWYKIQEELRDYYIRNTLRIRKSDITPEIIELRRKQLTLKKQIEHEKTN